MDILSLTQSLPRDNICGAKWGFGIGTTEEGKEGGQHQLGQCRKSLAVGIVGESLERDLPRPRGSLFLHSLRGFGFAD